MNTFKKKSLHAAVLAGLGALTVAGSANAVHINSDGLGQVLIFPYYTARGGQFTSMSVINTTSQTKAVKVRFLEGRTSREVLDFNLFLSPQDVWTGAVVDGASGARLISGDNSCVTPSNLFVTAGLSSFKPDLYQPAPYSKWGTSLDRTREGYFEVIEMGIVTSGVITSIIKHGANGAPANCQLLDQFDPFNATFGTPPPPQGYFSATNLLGNPTGGLAGRASIVNGGDGSNYTYAPTAVDAWAVANPLVPASVVQYSQSGDLTPDLGAVTPLVSNVFVNSGVQTSTFGAGLGRDVMSSLFMRDSLLNEYILDADTRSLSDWIVTFPTKRLHMNNLTGNPLPGGPFTLGYNDPNAGCEAYSYAIYNREEGSPQAAPGSIPPSPRPVTQPDALAAFCWEATVVPFGASSLLKSVNLSPLTAPQAAFAQGAGSVTTRSVYTTSTLPATNGPNGWMFANLIGAGRTVTPASATFNGAPAVTRVFNGLPVVGALLHNSVNSATAGSLYGGYIEHRYNRFLTVAP